MFSAFNPSKCTHLEQWAADCAAPGEQSWTSCRAGIRTHNLGLPRVSSPTLYPLGQVSVAYGQKRGQWYPPSSLPFSIFLPMQKRVCVCATVQYVKWSQLEQCALNQQQPESFLHERCSTVQEALTCICVERGQVYEKKREVGYAWFIKVDQICDMFIEAEVLYCKKKKQSVVFTKWFWQLWLPE